MDGLDGIVRALKQPINNGNYAFWVGDESTKANFSVQAEDPATLSASDYRNYLQVPQRIGWERMKGFESVSLDPYDPIFEKVVSHNQISLVNTGLDNVVKENFHHITSYSRSLFTDTALGGLKKDLTRYLEDGDGLNDNDPIADPDRYDPDDARFAAWGGTNTGFPNSSNAALDGIPTWGQIRDWYQNESTGGSGITPSEDFAPIITYMNFHMGYSFDPASGEIRIHWVPSIVLWNPYDVPLNSESYDIDVGHSHDYFQFYVASPNVNVADVTLTDAAADGTPDTPGTEGTFRNNTIPASGTADFFYALEAVSTDWNNKANTPQSINFFSRNSDSVIGGSGTGNLRRDWNPMRDKNNWQWNGTTKRLGHPTK